jgi:mRNA interferase MazF
MPEPRRGEVWLADLNPTRRREQRGRRPVVIMSVDLFNAEPAELVMVLPITSTDRGIPLHVRVRKGVGGTKNNCVVMCEAIRSIAKERLITRCGVLPAAVMSEIEDRLRVLLEF